MKNCFLLINNVFSESKKRLTEFNLSLHVIYLCIMLIFFTCKKTTEPRTDKEDDSEYYALIDTVGAERTLRVGNYTILADTTGGSVNGEKVVIWEFHHNPNNPVWREPHITDTQSFFEVFYTIEGVYNYTLYGRTDYNDTTKFFLGKWRVTVLPREKYIFEDVNLEIGVRYKIKKPFEKITDAVLVSLEDLVPIYSPEKIVSLKGLEKCPNLRELDLSDQGIEDLSPLSNLRKLVRLDLDQNWQPFDLVPLANLTNMEKLDISSNSISDIRPLYNMKKLKYLNLSENNAIKDISVIGNFSELESIYMAGLPINDISHFAKLTKLKCLWFPACSVRDILCVKNMPNLQFLVFGKNSVKDLSPIAELYDLEWIYGEDNWLSDLKPLENLTKLTRVRFFRNQIEDIEPLVNNPGIGDGDLIGLTGNPLNDKSVSDHIPELVRRGCILFWSD